MSRRPLGSVALLGAGAVLVGSLAWRLTSEPPAPRLPGSWPSVAELDSLERYLHPASAAPALDDYEAYLPAYEPPRASEPLVEAPPAPPALRVSAILITGERRVAIINDRRVSPGEQLEGGARVVAIERDAVTLQEPSGARRVLRVTPAGEEASP